MSKMIKNRFCKYSIRKRSTNTSLNHGTFSFFIQWHWRNLIEDTFFKLNERVFHRSRSDITECWNIV